jgi:hypothetical protein
MHNGAEVDVEKTTNRHQENFTTFSENCYRCVKPKTNHEQRRSNPNRDCENKHKFQHSGYPLSFSGYIIAYLIIKKQHIYGKVCVKFWPGKMLI